MSWKSWRQRLDPEGRGVCDGWDNNSDLKAGAGLNTLRGFGLLLVHILSCLGDSDFSRIQTTCPDLWKDLAVAWPPAEFLSIPSPSSWGGCSQGLLCVHTELHSSGKCCSCHTSSANPPGISLQISSMGRGWSRAGRIKEMGFSSTASALPPSWSLSPAAQSCAGQGHNWLYCSGCTDLLSVLWHHRQKLSSD